MAIDLNKKKEAVNTILLTKGVSKAPIMRVGAALDISGSMESIIIRGDLQRALNQLMGVAMSFDDNGQLDVFKFDTRCDYVGTADDKNFENFVNKNNIAARGGTAYAPIIEQSLKFFFKGGLFKKADDSPVLMLIITDGEPNDGYANIKRVLEQAQSKNIYFHLVGVGGTRNNFPTIARLADDLPDVGEVYLPRFDLSDEEVYSQLICDELIDFVKSHGTIVA